VAAVEIAEPGNDQSLTLQALGGVDRWPALTWYSVTVTLVTAADEHMPS
jgi:hypothetical protein